MKTVYIKTIVLLIVFNLGLTGCTDNFEEINTNLNEPEQLSNPGLLLPEIIRGAMNDSYTGAWRRGNIVADYLANQFVSAFDWSPADAEEYFLWSYYGHLRNVQNVIDLATGNDMKNYEGIALVLKSYFFQSMTDIYGSIPYSQATKARSENINFPEYDTQEAIYAGILADLARANELLSPSNEAVTGDILYNGDVTKWKRFANSLRLRCLLRISDRTDPSAQMSAIVSDPVTYPLFTGNADQAALQYLDQLNNEFPRYRGQFGESASQTMVDILKTLNDPRLYVFAQPTPSTAGSVNPQYVGVPNGIADEDTFNEGAANQSLPGLLWAPLNSSPQYASPTAAQALLMTYGELQFILAEAAERGFISGDPEAYYLAGIKSQFDYYASRIPANFVFPKAPDVQPATSYYSQATVAYTGAQAAKLEKIWLQKWLSLFNCGFEGWSEWRRTGVPVITPGPNSLGFVPVRFLYPLTEQSTNNANYLKAVQAQGPDNTQTRVWWDVE